MPQNKTVVKVGSWLYNGTVPTGVRILESDTAFGTGDIEDQPDIRDDKRIKCFYVDWCTAGTSDWRFVGFGPYESLTEAMAHVTKLTNGTVVWQE